MIGALLHFRTHIQVEEDDVRVIPDSEQLELASSFQHVCGNGIAKCTPYACVISTDRNKRALKINQL